MTGTVLYHRRVIYPSIMVYRCLLVFAALLCCAKEISCATTYTIFINDVQVRFNDIIGWVDRSSPVNFACRILLDGAYDPKAGLKKIANGNEHYLTGILVSYQDPYKLLNYTLSSSDKRDTVATYRCVDRDKQYSPNYSQVTINFGQHPPSTAASTLPTGPQGGTTTSPGSTNSKFAGLNPLIYTISAVILLGTLAIVGIITCWIRARRSYNRRMFQATTNPQDYLDYISDNEFTPLTTSEFVASLQERPPTYNESEQIEGQMRSEPGEDGEASESGEAGEGGGTQSSSTRTPPPGPPPPTNSNSPLPQPSTSTGSDGNVRDVSEDHTATGADPASRHVLSGVDALLSMDLETGNGTQQSQLEPVPVSNSATESAAVETLIDFWFGDTTSSETDSQSTFPNLQQPTPEQVSEIEAAIGALNERMTRIRERTN